MNLFFDSKTELKMHKDKNHRITSAKMVIVISNILFFYIKEELGQLYRLEQ